MNADQEHRLQGMPNPHHRIGATSMATVGVVSIVVLLVPGTPRMAFAEPGQTAVAPEQVETPAVADPTLDYNLLFRSGSSYYSIPGESRFGGGYALEGALGLRDEWGFVGNLNVNHLTLGEQLLGSLGIAKLPDYGGRDRLDSLSLSLFFDQFTDTRIDTIEHSLYLGELRFQAGYSPCEHREVGFLYSEPIIRDTDVNFRFVQFPGSLPMAGRVDMSRVYGAYFARQTNCAQMALVAGYREDPGTFSLAANLRRDITDRMAVYASGSYENDQGNFGVGFGLEFTFGAGSQRAFSGSGFADGSTRVWKPPHTPRRQVQQVSYVPPGVPGEAPPNDLGTFGLNELNVPTPVATVNDRRTFSERWTRSLHRIGSQHLREAAMTYARRDADGFTDPVQRAVQAVAGFLGLQGVDGTIIGTDGQVFD